MALDNNPIENLNINNDEISLKELILKIKGGVSFLKLKWKLVFLAGLLGSLIGLTYASFDKPYYKALLTFALEEDKGNGSGLGGALGLASGLGIDIGVAGGIFSANNLLELMKSRLLVEKTLLNPILVEGKLISIAEYYLQIYKIREGWINNPDLKKIQYLPNADRTKFSRQQDSILYEIYASLTNPKILSIGSKEKKASITSVEVNSFDERFAKIFCENLVKETSTYYIEIKSKKAKMNVEILQHQADSIRYELNKAIIGVATSNDNVFNLNISLNVKRTPSLNRQIDVQANTAILNSLVSNLEIAKMALRRETPLIQVIDKPILPLEKTQLGKFKSLFIGFFTAIFLTILFLVVSNLYKKNNS